MGIEPARIRFLKQGVKLTGLGTPTFGQAMDAVNQMYGMFDRYFPEDTLEAINTGDVSNQTLDSSNRLLTSTRDAPDAVHRSFTMAVDDSGALEHAVANGDFIHTDDNHVLYYRTEKDIKGEYRLVG